MIKVKVNYSKNLFSLNFILAAIPDGQSNSFQRQVASMNIQINDVENGRNTIYKRKFRIYF